MPASQLPSDVKAQTGPWNRSQLGIVEPHEALEDVLRMVRRDPDPVVVHTEYDRFSVPDLDRHVRCRDAIGQGVVQEVIVHASKMVGIGRDPGRLCWEERSQSRPEQVGPRTGTLDGTRGRLADIEGDDLV